MRMSFKEHRLCLLRGKLLHRFSRDRPTSFLNDSRYFAFSPSFFSMCFFQSLSATWIKSRAASSVHDDLDRRYPGAHGELVCQLTLDGLISLAASRGTEPIVLSSEVRSGLELIMGYDVIRPMDERLCD